MLLIIRLKSSTLESINWISLAWFLWWRRILLCFHAWQLSSEGCFDSTLRWHPSRRHRIIWCPVIRVYRSTVTTLTEWNQRVYHRKQTWSDTCIASDDLSSFWRLQFPLRTSISSEDYYCLWSPQCIWKPHLPPTTSIDSNDLYCLWRPLLPLMTSIASDDHYCFWRPQFSLTTKRATTTSIAFDDHFCGWQPLLPLTTSIASDKLYSPSQHYSLWRPILPLVASIVSDDLSYNSVVLRSPHLAEWNELLYTCKCGKFGLQGARPPVPR